MRTFSVQTLGCKVNQYESEQIAAYLRSRGLIECDSGEQAELRIINSCSVTVQAASQSRQSVRRATRLPVISSYGTAGESFVIRAHPSPLGGSRQFPSLLGGSRQFPSLLGGSGQFPSRLPGGEGVRGGWTFDRSGGDQRVRPRVIVMGCWATSDREAAAGMDGVDAVLTHQDDLAAQLDRLLTLWQSQDPSPVTRPPTSDACNNDPQRAMKAENNEELSNSAADEPASANKPIFPRIVNEIPGSTTLPLLGEHQSGRQRAFLKIQDGCDAHCTYCIIPRLRPALWSKPVEDAVSEAQKLVRSGHREIVLTGIFLGAYGRPTALRRRRGPGEGLAPLAGLVEALCTRVAGLERLRLSSVEPGDVDEELVKVLSSHGQVVPHFHLPLQSGSDEILRRMNRQYRRSDFLGLVETLAKSFDRPALTTDVIVGFPGEADEQFRHTLEVVGASRFIHIHAFPYSPRPGTAAARWGKDLVPGATVNERIRELNRLSREFDHEFRQSFVGNEVSVVVERGTVRDGERVLRHGRCERYFAVDFEGPDVHPGDVVRVRVDCVTPERTMGRVSQ